MQPIKDLEAVAGILDLKLDATPEQVRAAYLAKVQQFPPDREPEKFAEIHQAYQWLCNPLAFAEALLQTTVEPPDLEAIVDAAKAQPPRLTPAQLLSLGNVQP